MRNETGLLCTNCSKLEQISFENWRGLGEEPSKSKKRTSYLEPAAELLEADYGSPREVIPISLLRNGHLVNLKPIRLANRALVTLSNTCGFDSLVQLMASTFCDSETFKQLIMLNQESSEISALVYDLVKNGVTRKTYRLRAETLSKVFPKKKTALWNLFY